ncbi:MAG: sensor domain-containing diguanylate cyclase [Planctomycetota bacterium]
MFSNRFVSLRLALALSCVGASLVAGAQWLGVIPNAEVLRRNARLSYCESMAIASIDGIDRDELVDLERRFEAIVDRDKELLALGLRNQYGTLAVDSGHHGELWPQTLRMGNLTSEEAAKAVEDAQSDSEVELLTIDMSVRGAPWGRMEFVFTRAESFWSSILANDAIRLLIYFVVVGTFAYLFFITRLTAVFSKTQVVPDRVRNALDTLAEGLIVLDGDGCVVMANEAFCSMSGKSSEELCKRAASDLDWIRGDVDAEGPNNADASVGEEAGLMNAAEPDDPWTQAVRDEKSISDRKMRLEHEGQVRIFSVNASPVASGDGGQRGALATFRDITHVEEHRREQEKMLTLLRQSKSQIDAKNKELEILATQDALTGCLNRRAFFEIFDEHWKDVISDPNSDLSCLMLDVDHFKSVNDTYGHHTGDLVLQAVSRVVRELFADNAVVCRYGGEEFCVLMPGTNLYDANGRAEDLRIAIEKIRLEDPAELRLSASLGVSHRRFDAVHPQDMINQADSCLYVAKRQGRNQVVLYNHDIPRQLSEGEEDTGIKVDIPRSVVSGLLTALSMRNLQAAQHARRVSDIVGKVASAHMDKTDQYVAEIAAMLHEVGWLAERDRIRSRASDPANLTEGPAREATLEIIRSAVDCPELTTVLEHLGGDLDNPATPDASRLIDVAKLYDRLINHPNGAVEDAKTVLSILRGKAGESLDEVWVERFVESLKLDQLDVQADAAKKGVSPLQKIDSGLVTGATNALSQISMYAVGETIEALAEAVDAEDEDSMRKAYQKLQKSAEAFGWDTWIALPTVEKDERRDQLDGRADNSDSELTETIENALEQCRSLQTMLTRMTIDRAMAVQE